MLILLAPSCKTSSYGYKYQKSRTHKPKKQKKNCKCPQFSYLDFFEDATYIVDKEG